MQYSDITCFENLKPYRNNPLVMRLVMKGPQRQALNAFLCVGCCHQLALNPRLIQRIHVFLRHNTLVLLQLERGDTCMHAQSIIAHCNNSEYKLFADARFSIDCKLSCTPVIRHIMRSDILMINFAYSP